MTRTAHRVFLGSLVIIVCFTLIMLIFNGISYYNTSLEERVYHPDHSRFKPSGYTGHGIGITGTLFMIVGMASYMARKRYRLLSRMGYLKHWLEFHIFLCTMGPILVLFHTAFKFGGIVAISFWSMVAVFISGIIGRFIYIQIPHTIEGRELSLAEIRNMNMNIKLNRSIDRIEYMKRLFKYWHVAHLPFALIMLIIMIIHVGVTVLFGYRWIF